MFVLLLEKKMLEGCL